MTIVYKIAVWLFVIYSLNLNAAASAAPQETKRIFARNALNGEFNCLIIVADILFYSFQFQMLETTSTYKKTCF